MLAVLLGFPETERRRLAERSGITTASLEQLARLGMTEDDRSAALGDCLNRFTGMRRNRPGGPANGSAGFVTALAGGDATQDLGARAFLGRFLLLIVGGNDTTRNSLSGGIVALSDHPAEYQKLQENPGLIPSAVHEMVRWQTPLAYMRQTATHDTTIRGMAISRGDKLVLWYVSSSRDVEAIAQASEFRVARKKARHHLSLGWGRPFCMCSRLAEMQLRIVIELVLDRFNALELMAAPRRARSSLVRGFLDIPIQVQLRAASPQHPSSTRAAAACEPSLGRTSAARSKGRVPIRRVAVPRDCCCHTKYNSLSRSILYHA